jgi:hypothetical protein
MEPILEIPILPAPGDAWFSLNLDLIEESQLPQLYQLLERFGMPLTPAHRGEETHYLLWQGKIPSLESPDSLFVELQQELADLIDPDAICFRCRLTQPQPVAA